MPQPPEQIALFHVRHRERVGQTRAPEPSQPQAPVFDPHGPQLAMFMTPHEIKAHYKPLEGDRGRNQGVGLSYGERETDEEVWKRKARESGEQGLTANIKRHGVLSPVQLQVKDRFNRDPQVLGGHHRVAAASQGSLIPVLHHEDIFAARADRHYPYERSAGVGRW